MKTKTISPELPTLVRTNLIARVIKDILPTIPVDTFIEILEATPNFDVAMAMLLNIYTYPKINNAKDTKREANVKYLLFCPFKEEITYSYNSIDIEEVWFLKESDIKKENIASTQYYADDASRDLNILREQFDKDYIKVVYNSKVSTHLRTREITLDKWNNR